MLKKRGWIALILVLTLLVLTGCGDQKRREEAAALVAEGKFIEAYNIYSGLQDREMKQDTMDKAYAAAQEAYSKGDFSRAAEILESFTQYRDFKALLEDVQVALSGTYVSDVKLDGSTLTFTLSRAEADMDHRVRIRLEANNDTVEGWIYNVLKPEDLPSENPCTVTIDLNEIKWSASMNRAFSFYDNSIFDIPTQALFSKGTMATFYKCIRKDGTEGLTMGMVLLSFGFGDTVRTFEGGKVCVAAYDEEQSKVSNKSMKGEQSADIPALKEEEPQS